LSSPTDCSTAMEKIYEATGVVNGKVTHHRTAALQHAGFEGLDPPQVNTMTHHFIEKQHSAYGPVAEKVVSPKSFLTNLFPAASFISHYTAPLFSRL
jgi:hypothetical protein